MNTKQIEQNGEMYCLFCLVSNYTRWLPRAVSSAILNEDPVHVEQSKELIDLQSPNLMFLPQGLLGFGIYTWPSLSLNHR